MPIRETVHRASAFASLIFHSLAARYATVLRELADVTGIKFRTLQVVGGGAQNSLLNRLTAQATGLAVKPGHIESSTIGNFAIQMAAYGFTTSSAEDHPVGEVSLVEIGKCACKLEVANYQ